MDHAMSGFTATPPSRYVTPSPAARWTIALAALAGAAVSMVLLRSHALPGCAPGSGCDAVLSSRWSQVLGVPVSAAAIVVYALVAAMLIHVRPGESPRRQRVAWRVLMACAAALLGAAAWFTLLQWAAIGQWCRWCMTAHACGAATGMLILWHAPIGRERLLPDEPPDPMLIGPWRATGLALAAWLSVAVLAGVQAVQPWRPAVTIGAVGGVVGEPTQVPLIGEPSARHLLVCMYDYTCPHCRAMHERLKRLRARFADVLAIVLMRVPLEGRCNPAVGHTSPAHVGACELAELALAVWRVDVEKFDVMDDWLFASPRPRPAAEARERARQLIGEQALDQALADGWPQRYIEQGVRFYLATGAGALPRLMPGRPDLPAEIFDVLERELGAQLLPASQ